MRISIDYVLITMFRSKNPPAFFQEQSISYRSICVRNSRGISRLRSRFTCILLMSIESGETIWLREESHVAE